MSGLIVALHGYEDDAAPLAAAVSRVTQTNAADAWHVLAPTGPADAPNGPSWFGADGIPDLGLVREATATVRAAVVEHQRTDGTPDRLVLGGFSQGGALALAITFGTGTDLPCPVDATFCLGGYLPAPDDVRYDFGDAAGRPVLLVHGADDETVPVQQARAAARALERSGAEVRLVEVSTGHALDDRLLAPLATWLNDQIPG